MTYDIIGNLEYKDNVYATCTYDTECTLNELEESLWEDGKKFINWVYMDKDLGDVIYNLTNYEINDFANALMTMPNFHFEA